MRAPLVEAVARHLIHLPENQIPPRWTQRYRCEWGIVVGDRVRRLRMAADLTLVELARELRRPDGGRYSAGFFSRLERGWASPPLWTYIVLAERYGTHPGRLLGADEAERSVTDAEMTLLKLLRRLGVEPDEAIERLFSSSAAAGARRASG